MGTAFAVATGALSTMTWWTTSGGPTLRAAPGVGDNMDVNNRNITLDIDVAACDAIVGAGTLSVSTNRVINANCGATGSTWQCTISTAGITVTVNGNVAPGSFTTFVVANATAHLLVNGNSTGGGSGSVRGIHQTAGNVTVTGTVTSTIAGGTGLLVTGAGTITVATVTSTSAPAVDIRAGTVNITTITGGTGTSVGGYGVDLSGGTLTVPGTITGGSGVGNNGTNKCYGVYQTGGTFTHTGNRVDTAQAEAVNSRGGTYTYNPGPPNTAIIGGKTMYPTSGGGTTAHAA